MWYQGLRVQVPSIAPPPGAATGGDGGVCMDLGYGVLLPLGLFTGLAFGLAVGQPSAGAVIGLGLGAALGALMSIIRPRR